MSLDQKTLDSLKIERAAPRREAPTAHYWIVAVLVVAGAAAGYSLQQRPIEVELAAAAATPAGGGAQAAAVLNASGYVLVARREATVSAKGTGKISAVLVLRRAEAERNLRRLERQRADNVSSELEVDVNESFIKRVQPGQKTEAVLDAYQAG